MKKQLFLVLAFLGISAFATVAQGGDRGNKKTTGANAEKTVIGFFGDSTIRGYRTRSGAQVPLSTPQAFAQTLAAESRFTVLNEGVDSSRIEHLMAGTDGKHEPWHSYIAKAGIDIVITNHASKNGNPVHQYEADLDKMVKRARAHGKLVILMTPNPIAEGGLEAYVDAMRRVAARNKVPVIDVFRFLNDIMSATGQGIDDFVPDGYHPADEVYVLIGRYAAREFRKIMLAQ